VKKRNHSDRKKKTYGVTESSLFLMFYNALKMILKYVSLLFSKNNSSRNIVVSVGNFLSYPNICG